MLLDDELGQFNRLTLGEVFHGIVMCCIEVRGLSLGIRKKTTDLTLSHWNQVFFYDLLSLKCEENLSVDVINCLEIIPTGL
jgi:hypothetical protein